MSRILFLTNIDRQYAMVQQARNKLAEKQGLPVDAQVVSLKDGSTWGPEWAKRFTSCNVVVISWMGTGLDTDFLKKATAFLSAMKVVHVMLATDPALQDTRYGVTLAEREIMRTYLLYSGIENYCNLWLWLSHSYCQSDCSFAAPQPLPWNGIFHPQAEQPYTELTRYRERFCQADRPTVGILFPRDEWVWSDLAYQSALITEIERQGMNAIAVFSHWARNDEVQAPGVDETVRAYFYEQDKPVVDVIINTIKFSLTVGRPVDTDFLKKLGVPVLQAYTLMQPSESWKSSGEGLTPMEISCSVAMAEFDGVIHAVPIAGKECSPEGIIYFQPIGERISRLVRKAAKWAQLKRKRNADKKIAIVFHNYPANNSNIGSAQGMDSPESIRLLLAIMTEQGYKIDHVPADSQAFMQQLVTQATNDRRFLSDEQIKQANKVSTAQYEEWFNRFQPQVREQLRRDWGPPPGDVFQYDGQLLVPGLVNGNVCITVQPPRGFGEDPAKIYHSPDCAPTHHYLAYYQCLRNVFQADAVIHVGTHGSLEWLPGKGAGLSEACYPDLAIGDLPNLYPYLITIVGEGTQAKRRGAACLIGHLPPPMSHADTYEDIADLEKLLDEYVHYQANLSAQVEVLPALIREKIAALNMTDDIPLMEGERFTDYLQRLHSYITDIKNMQIRVGLHVLGTPPEGQQLVDYVLALTRLDNDEAPALPQTVAACHGYSYYDLLAQSASLLPDGSRTYGALLDVVREQCEQVILILAEADFAIEYANVILELPWVVHADETLKERLRQTADYICRTLVPNIRQTEQEIMNLVGALEGKFVEPGPAGAPTSGMADILPTGRNFYGVDTRTLPTPAAWEIGKSLGDSVIEQYIAAEGDFPENIGMVIWSGANMRSRGQCIAEFFYLLGIRPVWQRGSGRVVDLEVIPLSELKRPRIDVTARVSGLFRDTMPVVMKWMDKAISLAAALAEAPEENYLRKHILAESQQLTLEGLDYAEALKKASYRIFGCPPGAYGAGVGAVLEEKNWETVDDLAEVYIRWGAHAYGAGTKGDFVPEVFSRRLGSLDVTIKNEDNREVHMLNSDDFNAYHGGMIAAVRSLKGQAPRSYCGDSSDRQKVVVRSLNEEFKRIFRGEVLNPKYREGMKKHGYKGAADLAGIVAHCCEWDATSAVMEDWMYQGLAQKYALARDMQAWLENVNPWALQRMVEKLLEASQRGLWQADSETQKELQQLYLSIEGELEERGEG